MALLAQGLTLSPPPGLPLARRSNPRKTELASARGVQPTHAAAATTALVAGALTNRRTPGVGARVVSKAAKPGKSSWSAAEAEGLRSDFPALQQEVKPGVPLVYLDNAATSQKPKQVLDELNRFYSQDNSNVHRGMHTLSMRSTEAFETARQKVAKFVNAPDSHEIVFTRNATEAINLVARTWGAANIAKGDEIVLTVMEHHANLVPWQLLAESTGAVLRFGRLRDDGTLDVEQFESLIGDRTKLVAFCHVSNVLGCVNPVERVAKLAHSVGAKVLVDACQSVPHMPVDVQTLGADWLVASGHKMCGPTGIGFLWGRGEILRGSPPFLGGGEMIDQVTLEGSTFNDIPHKFEAGTPAFAEAVALGAACEYLTDLGMAAVSQRHRAGGEHELAKHLWSRLEALPGIHLYGPSPETQPDRASLVCFNVDGCHANDLATLVDQDRGVAMRSGHHCTQPLHGELGVTASARLSAYFYNTIEEIDVAVDALEVAIGLIRTGPAGDEPELDPAMAALLDA
ncbi:csd [Symbiodinium necroappetens]|uniref:cysteine desulfurase n=1 Tax=Symbiodinium necroappetens TaxID=1628268 RepID=A0A813AY52_9DINO|nr:csd [Symbiodinium necroappetens]